MERARHITVLGGGPAGLAVGYYARRAGLEFTLYEGKNRAGGNCATLQHGDFRFDSGAHRFHDKDPEVTREIKKLLGEELVKIDIPSQIWHRGRFLDFPLSPFNLLLGLGPWAFAKATASWLRAQLKTGTPGQSFEDFALSAYGKDIASRFLLGYSEKLWGAPCALLSSSIAGSRIKGLGLKTFLIEALRGKKAKTKHLDGSFYYPRQGFGVLVDRLTEACGSENIVLQSRITRIYHRNRRIQAIEVNGGKYIPVDQVASTLPLRLFLAQMDPAPPRELVALSKSLRYRHVVLVVLFLNKDRVTRSGSVYFPDAEFPFTRIHEPINRSPYMAPPGKTSLVVEIPCQTEDPIWTAGQGLVDGIALQLSRLGWISQGDVSDAVVQRLSHAYPILDLDHEKKVRTLAEYLGGFENLKLTGRNGKFVYTHFHDMMRFGISVVDEYLQAGRQQLCVAA